MSTARRSCCPGCGSCRAASALCPPGCSARAAAGGVAIITMIGSLGGFIGPALTGKLRDLTNNFTLGLLVLAGLTLVGAGLCFALPRRKPEHDAVA